MQKTTANVCLRSNFETKASFLVKFWRLSFQFTSLGWSYCKQNLDLTFVEKNHHSRAEWPRAWMCRKRISNKQDNKQTNGDCLPLFAYFSHLYYSSKTFLIIWRNQSCDAINWRHRLGFFGRAEVTWSEVLRVMSLWSGCYKKSTHWKSWRKDNILCRRRKTTEPSYPSLRPVFLQYLGEHVHSLDIYSSMFSTNDVREAMTKLPDHRDRRIIDRAI